jgi:hypothetical protein
MSLNIKNEETHRRAQELARLAGGNYDPGCGPCHRAPGTYLEEAQQGALAERLLEIGIRAPGCQFSTSAAPKRCSTTRTDYLKRSIDEALRRADEA